MTFTYPLEIVQLLVAPSHAYFGRSADGPADVPTLHPESVEVVEGKGIRGDRFFGVRAHTEAAVSFLAIEAWEAATTAANGAPWDGAVSVARRNVVTRGLELDPLRGEDFAVDTGDGPVLFRGGRPAHPCAWMDRMVVDGTRKALIGRGGLRAGVLGSGVLRVGPGVVLSPVPLDAARAADSVRRAQPLGH
ncbi:molybdenum cofactor biosysynthesis protein [Rhodococcoides corynebacterioides]|uniref:molybdenum cofactor biosysynthesis protein n=1 Tax=Rhodococcoides corynebacterioides TaxID=53972 RepID=UPI000833064F|nr:molybdenum cofactor biosysynthesis protein [Rhodococcus corynebacterioides]MBY6348697.1 molybdenum cofactor biosysynthesis protein [Rhodococcus corynebacterioides]MBY6361895.1 molybdenum cofactor biosysynthesis protein [Rhodococcus corynebacterioides]